MVSLILAETGDGLEWQFGRLKVNIKKKYIHQEGSAALKWATHGAARIYDFAGFQDFLNINMTYLICCSNSLFQPEGWSRDPKNSLPNNIFYCFRMVSGFKTS